MKIMLLGRKLFGHTENIKVQADLNEVCCILKLLCNLNFWFLPVFVPALKQLKFCWKQKQTSKQKKSIGKLLKTAVFFALFIIIMKRLN